jgi:hypothetical protein
MTNAEYKQLGVDDRADYSRVISSAAVAFCTASTEKENKALEAARDYIKKDSSEGVKLAIYDLENEVVNLDHLISEMDPKNFL